MKRAIREAIARRRRVTFSELPELLTRIEAGHLLRMSKDGLRKWRAAGYGPPHLRLRHRVFYLRRDIEEFLSERLERSGKAE